MDEARRFLRYVMPGIVYGVVTMFLLWIICPKLIQGIISSNTEKDNLGTFFGSVLVSGGLGYIFSTIHHGCHWLSNENCAEKDKILDHEAIAKKMFEDKVITERATDSLDAMAISYAYWCQQITNHKIGKAAENKVNSLGDQAHGLGAARVASVLALPTTLMIGFTCATPICENVAIFRIILMLLFWTCVTWSFQCGYRRLGKIAHKTYRTILEDTLPSVVNTGKSPN